MSLVDNMIISLKEKIVEIMQKDYIDNKVLVKWYKFDIISKKEDYDEKLWKVWMEYLNINKEKHGDEFIVDDVIVKFIRYIERKRQDNEVLYCIECSSVLIKYIEYNNRKVMAS